MEKEEILMIVFGFALMAIVFFAQLDNTLTHSAPPIRQESTLPSETESETTIAEVMESIRATQASTERVTEAPTMRVVTSEEYQLLLRVCMSECGGKYGEPLEGKIAVVETVLNRVDLGYGSITEVITAPNQYSIADNGNPDETVREAVDIALTSNMYPDNMIYFRTNHYHVYGKPYKQIGAHYFSLEE